MRPARRALRLPPPSTRQATASRLPIGSLSDHLPVASRRSALRSTSIAAAGAVGSIGSLGAVGSLGSMGKGVLPLLYYCLYVCTATLLSAHRPGDRRRLSGASVRTISATQRSLPRRFHACCMCVVCVFLARNVSHAGRAC